MDQADHDRNVAAFNTLWREYQALQAEVSRLKAEVMTAAATARPNRERAERAETLISWVDGMLVDEAEHAEIRAGIGRYWKARKA